MMSSSSFRSPLPSPYFIRGVCVSVCVCVWLCVYMRGCVCDISSYYNIIGGAVLGVELFLLYIIILSGCVMV